MQTTTVIRFMYLCEFDMKERPGMLVTEIPDDHHLEEEELLTLASDRGHNVTRIIHINKDISSDWVVLSDDMFH